VLGSTLIANTITLAEYEDYPEEYYTDHTPIIIQMHFDCLDGKESFTQKDKPKDCFQKIRKTQESIPKERSAYVHITRLKPGLTN
jgi:hypothetical protein